MMSKLKNSPEDIGMLEKIGAILKISLRLVHELDIQEVQNSFFTISKEIYPKMSEQASCGDATSQRWVESFKNLSDYLNVEIE